MRSLVGSAELPDDSSTPIELDEVAVLEPTSDTRHGHNGGNAQLASHNRGVREKAAALDEHAECRREDQDPPWVGVFGDEHRSMVELDIPRVRYDLHPAPDDARTTAETAPLVPSRRRRNFGRRRICLRVVHQSSRLEPIVR